MNQHTHTAVTRMLLAGLALCLGLPVALAQVGVPDYYASPNYAVSKLPTASCRDALGAVMAPPVLCGKDSDCPGYKPPFVINAQSYPGGATCSGPVAAGTGIRKFVVGAAGGRAGRPASGSTWSPGRKVRVCKKCGAEL